MAKPKGTRPRYVIDPATFRKPPVEERMSYRLGRAEGEAHTLRRLDELREERQQRSLAVFLQLGVRLFEKTTDKPRGILYRPTIGEQCRAPGCLAAPGTPCPHLADDAQQAT